MYNSVMQSANSSPAFVRGATDSDRGQIFLLLKSAPYRHIHSDYHLPADWLGTPGFVVNESVPRNGEDKQLVGILAAAADPTPAAWVRLAALASRNDAAGILIEMLASVLPHLREKGVDQLGWFPSIPWPEPWFLKLGFEPTNRIVTYVKEGLTVPALPENGVTIRAAVSADFPTLAEIEASAFEPLWRHSAGGLKLAYPQAQLFHVAEWDGRIAGFQYSVEGSRRDSAHLVRITVDSKLQGHGIGSALMRALFKEYRSRGIRRITLNTQADNESSLRLYRRFDFHRIGDELPVWTMPL